MKLQRLAEELTDAMRERTREEMGGGSIYGIAQAETEDGFVEVWMYSNRNMVVISHRDDENQRECKNLERYLEDVLPTWFDLYDDDAYPSNQIAEMYNQYY